MQTEPFAVAGMKTLQILDDTPGNRIHDFQLAAIAPFLTLRKYQSAGSAMELVLFYRRLVFGVATAVVWTHGSLTTGVFFFFSVSGPGVGG